GVAARVVAGRRGEAGGRVRRRVGVRGATASAVAGCGGECEGGAQRRRGRRRSTAASWWRGAGRAAPAHGEMEGGSRRRKERGWMGERGRGGERKERCMKDKDAQSACHVIDTCSHGGVWTCGERLKKFRDPKMHFRS